jgi:hypothetical protein
MDLELAPQAAGIVHLAMRAMSTDVTITVVDGRAHQATDEGAEPTLFATMTTTVMTLREDTASFTWTFETFL